MSKKHFDDNKLSKLLRLSQEGDKNSYREFLQTITPLLLKIANKAFHKDDVTDIVQDIYVSIHKSLPSYDPNRSATPWVCAIANRRVIDYIRKIEYRSQNEEHFVDGDVTNYSDQTKTIIDQELPPFLELVPKETKEALILTKIEGYSTDEAAKLLGLKSNALRTRISRGLKTLRDKLEEDLENG